MVWRLEPDEVGTAVIEGITLGAAILIILIVIYLRFTYPKLTAKGFNLLILGFGVFALHILCDFLDTLVAKEINDEKTFLYLLFDLLDALFSFIGLFIVGLSFLFIANYGMKLWREEN